MAVEHWSQMRQPVLMLGIDATVLFPIMIILFRFPHIKWWLISLFIMITIVLITKFFKYQFRYVIPGMRKFFFGADKRTKKASRNFNF